MLELRVDESQVIRRVKRGSLNVQWIYPSCAVEIVAILIATDAPPLENERRLSTWNPQLEAGPPGVTHPRIVCSRGRWIEDQHQVEASAKARPQPLAPTPK